MTTRRPEDLDPRYLDIDPLRPSYTGRILEDPDRYHPRWKRRTALLCIDLQVLDAAPDRGMFAEDHGPDLPAGARDYYFSTLEHVVLPNVRRLQDCFREQGLEVIHIRIQSLTRDGRDRSPAHKRLRLFAPPGSDEARFLEQVAPEGDEVVINKTASGVFNSTNLEYVLRNLRIRALFVTGVFTDECVSTTVRDANDRGFFVTLVEDACASVTPKRHEFTVATLRDRYTRVLNTADALDELAGTDEKRT